MTYFNSNDIKLHLSPAIYDNIFGSGSQTGFGGISAVSGSLRFTQLANEASDYVDSFLLAGGYDVPLSSPPQLVKRAAIFRFVADVYTMQSIPINDQLLRTIEYNDSVLEQISIGKFKLTNTAEKTTEGVGGHLFSQTTGSFGTQLGNKLFGTFL